MPKPLAVITGDVHFTLSTLETASAAVIQAIAVASDLKVPFILNGDTLDSKAIIRGEISNRIIEIFSDRETRAEIIVNTGNHDLLSEKSKESSLNFLAPYAEIISIPTLKKELDSWIIPYQNDSAELGRVLSDIPKGARLILHQGVQSAFLGHYVQDRTSLPKEAFADFRVIASHYHRAQSIKCGRPRKDAVGLFSYCGSPYSFSFAEAEDGPKGFQILMDDGSLEFVPTNLRKHMIVERTPETILDTVENYNPGDLVWLKVKGPYSELEKLSKRKIGEKLFGHSNFKFDKIYTSEEGQKQVKSKRLTGEELMDKLIDETTEAQGVKASLKKLWREVV